jgi:hypothetical protein
MSHFGDQALRTRSTQTPRSSKFVNDVLEMQAAMMVKSQEPKMVTPRRVFVAGHDGALGYYNLADVKSSAKEALRENLRVARSS